MFTWHTSCMCILLITAARQCRGSTKSCKTENDKGGKVTDICYFKKDVKIIRCRRDERLLILNILHKVRNKCSGEDEDCCAVKMDDDIHDIGHCLKDREPYRSVMREVLEECSQKRYCVLANEYGSSIFRLKNATAGDGKRAVSLVTTHECVKGESAVSFCKNSSATGTNSRPVYISSQGMSLSPLDDNSCRCDVESTGNTTLTLLDVRLGTDPMNKLHLQTENSTMHGGENSLYFGHKVSVAETRWTMMLSLNKDRPPDNVLIKLEGHQTSQIKVSCYEPHGQTVETYSLQPKEKSSAYQCTTSYLPYLTFALGFLLASVVLIVTLFIFLKLKRNRKRNSSQEIKDSPKSITTRSSYVVCEDMDCVEELYSLPNHPSRQGSVSTRHGSVSNAQSSVRGDAGHPDEMTVDSYYSVAECSRPIPKPRSPSKPDLSIYSTASWNSFRIKMDDGSSPHATALL